MTPLCLWGHTKGFSWHCDGSHEEEGAVDNCSGSPFCPRCWRQSQGRCAPAPLGQSLSGHGWTREDGALHCSVFMWDRGTSPRGYWESVSNQISTWTHIVSIPMSTSYFGKNHICIQTPCALQHQKNVDRRYSITVSVLRTKSRSAEVSLINTLLWEQNLQNEFFEKRFRHMLPPLLSALRNKASDVSRKLIYRVGKP